MGYIEPTNTDQTISYSQLLLTVKRQIGFIESVEKILLEGANRVVE